ncbi:hypothetical protein [Cupriavidus oxalaticus]|uniref:Uncharacterized protein n=1 Tax=Cupriavidus oxalaticus TaxID=96344 RepID=A0A4P7LL76_9BURK|nr:hypothetical protein [Cupriavidus oxalaticus]QBY56318.1 hypothetical protein E0W60_35490 [Cupriavidus oxalaticus]
MFESAAITVAEIHFFRERPRLQDLSKANYDDVNDFHRPELSRLKVPNRMEPAADREVSCLKAEGAADGFLPESELSRLKVPARSPPFTTRVAGLLPA